MDEHFIDWLYGRGSRNLHIKEMAKKTVQLLKTNGSMDYRELCQALGISLNAKQKPKRKFYKVVNPLKSVALVSVTKDRYFLSPERFVGYMKKLVEDISRELK